MSSFITHLIFNFYALRLALNTWVYFNNYLKSMKLNKASNLLHSKNFDMDTYDVFLHIFLIIIIQYVYSVYSAHFFIFWELLHNWHSSLSCFQIEFLHLRKNNKLFSWFSNFIGKAVLEMCNFILRLSRRILNMICLFKSILFHV